MSFFVLKLVFAAMLIWLLITVALLVRHLRRKREGGLPTPSRKAPKAAKPAKEAKAPKETKPRGGLLAKKQPEDVEPEPEAFVSSRRRQLTTFAEDERVAAQAEAEALGLPIAERAEPEPQAPAEVDFPAPEKEPLHGLAEEPDAEDDAIDPEAPLEFDQIVMNRLEIAFEALQARELSLDDYRRQVLAEEDAVERHIARAQESGDEFELEAGLAARESVRWCLNWAQEQARLQ